MLDPDGKSRIPKFGKNGYVFFIPSSPSQILSVPDSDCLVYKLFPGSRVICVIFVDMFDVFFPMLIFQVSIQ